MARRQGSRSRTSRRGRPSGDNQRPPRAPRAPREPAGVACEEKGAELDRDGRSGGVVWNRTLERDHCLIKAPGLPSLVEQGTQFWWS